jgi:hypothetical protein
MTTKLRVKKICGKCEYWYDFPYVHCILGCSIVNHTRKDNTFITIPTQPHDCKNKRMMQQ